MTPKIPARMICEQLADGQVLGVDRSPVAIARSAARNREHLERGTLALHQVDLAGFDPAGRTFGKVLAVNVNVFWTGSAEAELQVLQCCLRPAARVFLCYEARTNRNR
jgi:hypothetical protein